jgi:hypothetical protein
MKRKVQILHDWVLGPGASGLKSFDQPPNEMVGRGCFKLGD